MKPEGGLTDLAAANDPAQQWCILRCRGRQTLQLARSLTEDGFIAWAPACEMKIRKARWNVHRDVRLPLMAGFVFAGAAQLVDLLQLADSAARPRRGSGLLLPAHPAFTVFHHFDRIPLVLDQDLEPLRELERAPISPADLEGIYRKGEKVTVTQGIFGGMGGIVERMKGDLTLVRFGRMRVEIPINSLVPSRKRAKAA